MPFGLKNTRATYQRLMNKVFVEYIRRIMEVYVDDMDAKTMGDGNHCSDLQENFSQIRKFNMRLNLAMCAF